MNRIVVFGETLADVFGSDTVLGGAPFNVARHLAAFGTPPLMVSAVGHDALGRQIADEFNRFALPLTGLQHVLAPSGVVDVTMDAQGGHAFHIRSGAAWDVIDPAAALRATAGDQQGWLYLGTLACRADTSRRAALALLQAHQGRVFVDLNWRDGHTPPDVALQVLRHADVLKVNEEELAMLCGWLGADGTQPLALPAQAQATVQALQLDLLLVTQGEQGATAFGGDGVCKVHVPAAPIARLVDTVGAGDAFAAVALAGLARGADLTATLHRAAAFAARICEVRGAVPGGPPPIEG